MGYWVGLLLLHCLHSSVGLPTVSESKYQDAAVDQPRVSPMGGPQVDVVAHEIATRNQDPTEHLVCRVFKMKTPHGVVLVPSSHIKNLITSATTSSALRKYLYSPAKSVYAALCVSPEKPRPYPLFFDPSVPISSPPASQTAPVVSVSAALAPPPESPVETVKPSSETPGKATTLSRDLPTRATSASAPAIYLLFNSPVGPIGILSST